MDASLKIIRIWKEMTDKIWGKNVLSRSVE